MTSEFPLHLSPSQVSSLGTCGEQFRLTRVARVEERPQWAGIGGSAVHRMTEDEDRRRYNPDHEVHEWEWYWQEALDEAIRRSPSYALEDYYVGGRASKEWPNKETPDWWAVHGPQFVKSWATWLDRNALDIWEFPDPETGELTPCIEYEVMAQNYGDYVPANALYVKSIIDRVLVDAEGRLYIVDLKSGSMTPSWPQQMALNNLGFKQSIACPDDPGAAYAGFWKARKGGIDPGWHDLSRFTDEWLWQQVANAKAIRDQHLFIAQPTMLCKSACGVQQFCTAVGGTRAHEAPFFPQDATLTQGKETQPDE